LLFISYDTALAITESEWIAPARKRCEIPVASNNADLNDRPA